MRWLTAFLGFLLWVAAAHAQTAGPCVKGKTPPGDSSSACASTAWVKANGGGGASLTRTEVAKAASYSVLSNDVGTDFNNAGASGSITFTLPAWGAGLNYCFSNVAGQTVVVQAGTGNFIEEANVQTASGGTAASTMNYSTVCVVAMTSAIWQIDRHIGGWGLT